MGTHTHVLTHMHIPDPVFLLMWIGCVGCFSFLAQPLTHTDEQQRIALVFVSDVLAMLERRSRLSH